jgi:hypothetical protein
MLTLIPAVAFVQIVLFLHIAAVIIGFGVIFAYPLIDAVVGRRDARAMPGYYRMRKIVSQRLINPGLAIVLVAGIYLASKEHQWSAFYVQWGLAAVVVIGALGGAFLTPNEAKLAELAERDVKAAGDGDVVWSAEYEALARRVAIVSYATSLLILVTVYLMTVHAGR